MRLCREFKPGSEKPICSIRWGLINCLTKGWYLRGRSGCSSRRCRVMAVRVADEWFCGAFADLLVHIVAHAPRRLLSARSNTVVGVSQFDVSVHRSGYA